MVRPESCATCRFRVMESGPTFDRTLREVVDRVRQECRFEPPRAGSGWPSVPLNAWCSYWEPVPAEPEAGEPGHYAAERARA